MHYPTPKIICLMGSTAVGKTHIAVELTKLLPISIISVDSGMIYRGLDIGTAKPSVEELKIAPHRLIDICDPKESYSAGRFREDAIQSIQEIVTQNRIPLLVGGTMLYFRALQQGLSTLPRADAILRAKIAQEAAIHGSHFLHQKLSHIDPVAATRIQPNDLQRLQRALELHALTGKTITELYAENKAEPLPYTTINIAISLNNKNLLQQRIKERLKIMLEKGFLTEVEELLQRGDLNSELPALRTIGYRQACLYLNKKVDYQTMENEIIIATRQLAKRQMTWLRSWPHLTWFDNKDLQDNTSVLDKIYSYLVDNFYK